MGPEEQLGIVLPTVCDLVDNLTPAQLGDPTPCDDFTVHGVIDHMIVLGTSFGHLFRGESPPEIAAPAVYGVVPAAEFRAAMEGLLDAVRSDGAMERQLDTPIGTLDGATFARIVAFDGLMHGWDIAVGSGQLYDPGSGLVDEIDAFARQALSAELREAGLFDPVTEPPEDATAIEALAAFSGRVVTPRWRTTSTAVHVPKEQIPTVMQVPGAVARHHSGFGDATGYGAIAGEYFSLGAGTDVAPLLSGMCHDACHAPHWGYMLEGELIVSFVGGREAVARGGELFYWPPGHTVRVVEDVEMVLFSPATEHRAAIDHMLTQLGD